MANFEPRHANWNVVPRDRLLLSAPRQPQNHAPQNLEVPHAAANVQLEGQMEYTAHGEPVASVIERRSPHDQDPADIAYHGMIDYRPRPLRDPPVPYVFPGARAVQGIPAQGRPNAPEENQEHALFLHAPQNIPPFLPEAAFPDPFAHRIPAPRHPAVENLRRLAIRYVHHPDSHVDLVSMEPGAAGFCKVVIVLELADIF